jgi:isoquinoline 1-oxidoreductase alpha subunit
MSYRLMVNGKSHVADVDGDTPLLWVLRDTIGLTGTKFGCGIASCGACTVHVNGEARRSCVSPIASIGSARIGTIEALDKSPVGQALQRAWLDLEVVQCGYCQSGQLMSAAALLAANPSPNDDDIDAVMSANICRCGTYGRIRAGIKLAASYLAPAGTAASKKSAA